MLLDGFEIAALVDALGLDRSFAERPLLSGFRQTAKVTLASVVKHAHHVDRSPFTKREAGALQMVVVGEHLFRAAHVACGAFDFDGLGPQIDGYVQAVFQQPQVFVAGAEEGLDIGRDLDILLHLESGFASITTHDSIREWQQDQRCRL